MFPCLILEKSNMSLIRLNSIWLALFIVYACSSIVSSLFSQRIISFMPITVLIGVRISWDMLARNFALDSLATMATCFSCSMVRKSRMVFKPTVNRSKTSPRHKAIPLSWALVMYTRLISHIPQTLIRQSQLQLRDISCATHLLHIFLLTVACSW